jgi:hypothetical protein
MAPFSSRSSLGGQKVRIIPNAEGIEALRKGIALGVSMVMLDAETEAKRQTPVRGGFRSFHPGVPPIGGTLRRSVHSVTFLDGRPVVLHAEAETGPAAAAPLPLAEEEPLPGRIVGYVGTNSGYGAYVDLGTRKMAARPFLAPGLEVALNRAPATMAEGIKKAGG